MGEGLLLGGWALVAATGALYGLVLGAAARPRWTGLPAWWPGQVRGVGLHLIYGAASFLLVGSLAAIATDVFPLNGILLPSIAACPLILALASGRRARRAHWIAAAGFALLAALGVAGTLWWLRDWNPVPTF